MNAFKAVAALLVLVLSMTPSFAQIGGGIFGSPKVETVLTVDPDGAAQFTKICDADCTDRVFPGGFTCAAGSAMAAAAALSPTITNPVTVKLGPGRYDECVAIASITDVTLAGAGPGATIIRVSGATSDFPNGGVLRIGADPNNITERIVIRDLAVQNDAFSPPESAIQVGFENGPQDGNPATWDDVLIENVLAIGNHDCIQWFGGSDPNDDAPSIPRLTIRNTVGVGGNDCLVDKGFAAVEIIASDFSSISNHCESTLAASLGEVTGTCQSAGSTTTCEIEAADGSGASVPDDFFNARKVNFSDASDPNTTCPATTADHWINDFVASTDIITFDPADANSATSACDYTIAAVYGFDNPYCSDVDWNAIAGGSTKANTRSWKRTAFHAGLNGSGSSTTAPDASYIRITDSKFRVESNDAALANNLSSTDCTNEQGVIAGLLLGYQATEPGATRQRFTCDNCTVDLGLNYDARDLLDPNCIEAAGVIVQGGTAYDEFASFSGTVRVVNRGDADAHTAGIASIGTEAAGLLRVPWAHIDVTNTVGSYAGTSADLWQDRSGVLQVGDVTSPRAVATKGNIDGWSERCFPYPDFVASTDNQPIPISDADVGLRLAYGACRCLGTCGAAEDISFEDDAGNAIGSAVACVDNTADLTWIDLRADADGLIPASKSPRFDTTTASGTGTDDLQVCVRYSTSRFAP